jgi:ABC-type antimicrobial peptide transport system permease subunit
MNTNLRAALKALLQNKLQAVLTLTGMSVGVAMVVIVSGLGRGAQQTIEAQIQAAGPTQITIRPGNFKPVAIATRGEQDNSGGELSESPQATSGSDEGAFDLKAASGTVQQRAARHVKKTRSRTPAAPLAAAERELLAHDIAGVRAVAASVEGNLSLDAGATNRVRVIHAHGFEPAWPEMAGWHLVQGRWISAKEHAAAAPLAMLTASAARRLWPDAASPLGQTLELGGRRVQVVGIITERGASDAAAMIIPEVELPLPLVQRLLHRENYDSITVRTTSVGITSQVARDITGALRTLHQLPDDTLDDFRVESQSVQAMPGMGIDPQVARAVHSNVVEFEQASWEEMAKSLRKAGRTFALLLGAAAAVSLLVGGIGVMNIMLVSVTARTREIGLRMAVGARTRDVMTQFLVEAVTLAALGGLVGLGLGSLGLLLASHGFHWATAVSPGMLLAAVLMAALTGIVFGYGPARRAAVLDPVVALRKE